MSARNEYQQRLQARQQLHAELCELDDRAVFFRMAAFGIGAISAWAVLGSWQLSWWLLLLPIVLFVGAVIHHESIQRKKRHTQRAIDYCRLSLNRLDGKWSETGPTGEEFSNPQHPYSGDLDIFGKGSLYQLLGSPITTTGEQTLAKWLAPDHEDSLPTSDTIRSRQNAVRSLLQQTDLREHLAVIGPSPQPKQGRQLLDWLASPSGLTAKWILPVASVLGILGLCALGTWFVPGLLVIVLLELAFVHKLRNSLNPIKQYSEPAVHELQRIVQVVAALETIEGADDEIARLRSVLIHEGARASGVIRRLEKLVSQFENMRRNLFFAPLAFLSMLNIYFACAIDRWRAKHGSDVKRWFQAVGELEALLAFSRLHFENPTYCFPKLEDSELQFKSKELAHPLIAPGSAVANDVELSKECRMLLVSGSNMSGKSTLLRSVGINTVLAWAGAPVCAQSLTLSRLRVAAAMRVQDSLQTGTSHFYAELKRIRLVVELAEQSSTNATPVLFLLDEILHGTNSHDRLVGARSVIHSLLTAGAIGLVTTHDLALSDMVAELDQPAHNVHFCDHWRDGQMTFDYKMREGIVPKSNALSLMRLLGLEVEN